MKTRAAKDLARLRRQGLAALGQANLLSNDEWNASTDRMLTPEYIAFKEGCRRLGERFGLATWTVEMMGLLKGFRPEESVFALEQDPPRVRLITRVDDLIFLGWLIYETWKLNNEDGWSLQVYVVQARGPSETTLIQAGIPRSPERRLNALELPSLDAAVRARVETPPMYPPEAAQQLQRAAASFVRELLRRLGYRVPARLRTIDRPAEIGRLNLGKRRLHKGEAGNIADKILGEEGFDSLKSDKPHKAVRLARHRTRRKLERHDQRTNPGQRKNYGT